MFKATLLAAALAAAPFAVHAQAAAPNDAQIAHIAYTAGQIDIAAGQQALAKSKDKAVREFAQSMVRDHTAVNDQALALVKKLGVTPQDNPTSQALSADAAAKLKSMAALDGAAFDRAYLATMLREGMAGTGRQLEVRVRVAARWRRRPAQRGSA